MEKPHWWNIKGLNLYHLGYEPSALPFTPMLHILKQSIHSPLCHRYSKEKSIYQRAECLTALLLIPCEPCVYILLVLNLVAPIERDLQACKCFFLRAINVYQFRAVLGCRALPFSLEREAADYPCVYPLTVFTLYIPEKGIIYGTHIVIQTPALYI